MSETKDDFIYNFYDYMKSIFIYSHVRTYLIDPKRQEIEFFFDYVLLLIAVVFVLISLFKLLVIIIYFFCVQALPSFIKFIKMSCKSNFKTNYQSSCKNAMNYLKKVTKRIFTFNFYLFDNNIIGFFMVLSYVIFILSSVIFNWSNVYDIHSPEKSENYMIMFYLHFESVLLIQILCSSFYGCHNTKLAMACGFGIFLLLNGILLIGYFITERIEDVDGKFELDDPQAIMNIIFNIILFLLNGNCLYILVFKKFGKLTIIINLYFIYRV